MLPRKIARIHAVPEKDVQELARQPPTRRRFRKTAPESPRHGVELASEGMLVTRPEATQLEPGGEGPSALHHTARSLSACGRCGDRDGGQCDAESSRGNGFG